MEATECVDNKEGMDDYEEELRILQVQEENDSKKNPVKRRRFQSSVWNYFEILPASHDSVERCRCKNCGQIYLSSSKYGTGNMLKHVKRCWKGDPEALGQLITSKNKSGSAVRSKPSPISISTSTFDQEKSSDLLTSAVIIHDFPFQFVEWAGFNALLECLRHDVNVSESDCKAECEQLYMREKSKVQELLCLTPGRVHLTFDHWSSLNTDGYIRLTAHFVDKYWHLKRRILNFCFISFPQESASLVEKLVNLLTEWRVDKKIGCLAFDNASADNICTQTLKNKLELQGTSLRNGTFFSVRCCGQVINAIVQDGLNQIADVVEKVRESIRYVKAPQARKEQFLESVKKCTIESRRDLMQDVPTRWNSTYIMLDNALCYKNAFVDLMSRDNNYKNCPCGHEWEKIERMLKFLRLFYDIACAFWKTKVPTTNLYFARMFVAYLTLRNECYSFDDYNSSIATNMFDKFEKYWDDVNVILAIAVCLDPRYKIQFVEWCYKKLYGEAGSIKTILVKDELHKLYDGYRTSSKLNHNALGSSLQENGRASHDLHSSSSIIDNILKEFEPFEAQQVLPKESELELYLNEPRIAREIDLDVLAYWKVNEHRYPKVASLARDVLSIPLCTIASESAFNVSDLVLDQYRSSLNPEMLEELICTRDWLYGEQELSKRTLEELVDDIVGVTLNDIGPSNGSATNVLSWSTNL